MVAAWEPEAFSPIGVETRDSVLARRCRLWAWTCYLAGLCVAVLTVLEPAALHGLTTGLGLLFVIFTLSVFYMSWARTARIRRTRDPGYRPWGSGQPGRRRSLSRILGQLFLVVVVLSSLRDFSVAAVYAWAALAWSLGTWVRLRFGRAMFGETYLDDVVDAYR